MMHTLCNKMNHKKRGGLLTDDSNHHILGGDIHEQFGFFTPNKHKERQRNIRGGHYGS